MQLLCSTSTYWTVMTHLWKAICKAERGCRLFLLLHLHLPIQNLKPKLLLLHLLLVVPEAALKGKCLLLLLLWVVAVVITKLRVVVITCKQRFEHTSLQVMTNIYLLGLLCPQVSKPSIFVLNT